MGSVVVADQRPLDGCIGSPVVPDAHGRQALGDPGVQALGGPAAVPLQVELALEGVVDRLDPLPDPADRAVPGASSLRSGRTRCSPYPVVTRSSNSRPANPLSPMRIRPGRSASTASIPSTSANAPRNSRGAPTRPAPSGGLSPGRRRTAPGWRRSAAPGRTSPATGGPGDPGPGPAAARLP